MFQRLRANRASNPPVAEPIPAELHEARLKQVQMTAAAEVTAALQLQEQMKAELLRLSNTVQQHAGEKAEATALLSASMQQQTTRMHEVAARTSTLSDEVCSASSEAARGTKVIESAAQRLAGTITEVNSRLGQASDATRKAVEASTRSKETISELSAVVSKIGEVVSVIREIAQQTNLLALNATIEAARAGEAGKGFAVVANEVKQLSTQTARSTEDIRLKLEEIVSVTQRSVQTTDEFDLLIKEVASSASAVSVAMQDQSAATDEIVRSVSHTLPAVERAADSMTHVNQEAKVAGELAGEVKTNALNVMNEIVELRDTISGIVRASTGKLDRRGPSRYRVNAEARIDGDVHAAVTVKDISLSGALITGGHKLQAGQAGRIILDRQSTGFTVVSSNATEQRIKFTDPLNDGFKARFLEITEKLVPISQRA